MNNTIYKTVFIHAPVSVVWSMLTRPENITLWLWEKPVEVISEWQQGSPVLFKSTFHNEPYTDKGNILKFEPEKIFSYNYWSHLSQLPDIVENYQVVEFGLFPKESGTELHLNCSNTINEAIYGHWNFYWTVTLQILKKVVEADIKN